MDLTVWLMLTWLSTAYLAKESNADPDVCTGLKRGSVIMAVYEDNACFVVDKSFFDEFNEDKQSGKFRYKSAAAAEKCAQKYIGATLPRLNSALRRNTFIKNFVEKGVDYGDGKKAPSVMVDLKVENKQLLWGDGTAADLDDNDAVKDLKKETFDFVTLKHDVGRKSKYEWKPRKNDDGIEGGVATVCMLVYGKSADETTPGSSGNTISALFHVVWQMFFTLLLMK